MILLTMMNHFYMVGDVIYKQRIGGPIGLRLTGVIAKIFMHVFDQRFKSILAKLGIVVRMYTRVVDDINMVVKKSYQGK